MKKLNYLIAAAGVAGLRFTTTPQAIYGRHEEAKVVAEARDTVKHPETLQQLEGIINSNKYVAVDIGATWCGPCRKYAPTFEAVAKDYEGKVVFCKVVLDKIKEEENNKISKKYQVSYIPKTILFKDKKEVHSRVGYMDETTLRGLIDDKLEQGLSCDESGKAKK